MCGVTGIQKMARGLARILEVCIGCDQLAFDPCTSPQGRTSLTRHKYKNVQTSGHFNLFCIFLSLCTIKLYAFLPSAKCKFLLNDLLRQILLQFLCYILSYGSVSSSQFQMPCILFALPVLPYRNIIFLVPICMNGMYRINGYEVYLVSNNYYH